jgi:hypothetical protein
VIVQMLEFHVAPGHEAEVASYLTHIMSDEQVPPAIQMRCAGKRLNMQKSQYIVATCWDDDASMARGTDAAGVPQYLAPKAELLGAVSAVTFDVSAAIGLGLKGARIMRVYRAQVAAETLPDWQDRWISQITGLAAWDGLVCVRAGVQVAAERSGGMVPVLAIGAWRDWEAVLAATGGHIDRLILETDTPEVERLASIDHYQLLEGEGR